MEASIASLCYPLTRPIQPADRTLNRHGEGQLLHEATRDGRRKGATCAPRIGARLPISAEFLDICVNLKSVADLSIRRLDALEQKRWSPFSKVNRGVRCRGHGIATR